ncbi:hypothetical protein JYP51_09390 [Ponticoccus gilvus]|nr:hypothetical protein [Enemella evansiae]
MTVSLVWPAELDPPERDGWGASWADPREHRQAERGPSRYGRRVSAVSRHVSLSIVCTRAQKGVFDRFFEQDTRMGSLLFRMPDPATDGWPLLTETFEPLLTETGQPLLDTHLWLCLFAKEMPSETVVEQVKFRIAFSVEVLPE